MGGRGSRSRMTSGAGGSLAALQQVLQPQQPPLQAPLPNAAQQPQNDDEDDFHIATAQDEAAIMAVNAAYSRTMRQAQMDYINPNQQANGYSFSQNLNHDLIANGPNGLTGREAQVYNTFMQNMAPIGRNLILNRATHAGLINKLLGVSDYQKLSDAQLNSRLTGVEYTDDKFVSTAWDQSRNPFTNGGPVSGGREVYMNIRAPSWTPAVVGDKREAELDLKPGLKYRITGAHYNGQVAYPQKKGAMKRIVVDVEIIP